MSDCENEIHREDRDSAPAVSERSSLTQHSDSDVVYGIHSRSSNTEDDSTDRSSFGPGEEEALIGSHDPVLLASQGSSAPLSNKAILWIVLPMVLGWSLPR